MGPWRRSARLGTYLVAEVNSAHALDVVPAVGVNLRPGAGKPAERLAAHIGKDEQWGCNGTCTRRRQRRMSWLGSCALAGERRTGSSPRGVRPTATAPGRK